MKICVDCGTSYDAKLQSCPQCTASAGQERGAVSYGRGCDLVQLATFGNAAAADMVQEFLESNGLSATVRGDADPIGATSGAEPIQVLVPREELAEAQGLYRAFFESAPAEPTRAPDGE